MVLLELSWKKALAISRVYKCSRTRLTLSPTACKGMHQGWVLEQKAKSAVIFKLSQPSFRQEAKSKTLGINSGGWYQAKSGIGDTEQIASPLSGWVASCFLCGMTNDVEGQQNQWYHRYMGMSHLTCRWKSFQVLSSHPAWENESPQNAPPASTENELIVYSGLTFP